MRLPIFALLIIGLSSWSFAQTLPQSDLTETLQNKVSTALQQEAETYPVFGEVEALWQYIGNPPHNRSSKSQPRTTRTKATAVVSGHLVFIHVTPRFTPGGLFVQQPKLAELTFTALDGTKIVLQPALHPLKRHWVFTHIKTNAD